MKALVKISSLALIAWACWCQVGAAGTLQVIRSIDFPFPDLLGADLAWDGQYLWTSFHEPNGTSRGTYALDPRDGSVVRQLGSVEYGDPRREGHAWDATNLWVTSIAEIGGPPGTGLDFMEKLSGDGTVIGRFELPHSPSANSAQGAAWDGRYLWLATGTFKDLAQIEPTDGRVINAFTMSGITPRGLEWAEGSLWTVDGTNDAVYRVGTSGDLLGTWDVPGTDPQGIAFDGQYFWILDNDAKEIFQVVIPEPGAATLLGTGAAVLLLYLCASARRLRGKR